MPYLNPMLFDVLDACCPAESQTVTEAFAKMSSESNADQRGAVFTRPEIVNFMLDLAGYTKNNLIHRRRIIEPSFGEGDFLVPIIERLLSSWRQDPKRLSPVEDLKNAVRAVEVHKDTFDSVRHKVIRKLEAEGLTTEASNALSDEWLIHADFLLKSFSEKFDYVVGNPPYVRQEQIPAALLAEYRKYYSTIYDRADLYIPFIERSLILLKPGGTLVLICSDRWTKNRYGGPLRDLIANSFHIKAYIDMTGTAAFQQEVSAYPAITVISNQPPGATRIVRGLQRGQTLDAVTAQLQAEGLSKNSFVQEAAHMAQGSAPWLLGCREKRELIRRLERQYPTLEQAGCKVGIGVATGADKVFIVDCAALDVESDRKIPLATTRDIRDGGVVWHGQCVINPFQDDGKLVDLSRYPKLARYFDIHKNELVKRHCAKKAPANWYRTIDRIWPHLTEKPKLLIPDIKNESHVVFESGKLYPHHNLYYVVSDAWDLHALHAVLLSRLAELFVEMYTTKMRGGYLRFQAQYLRRIRIPFWRDVSEALKTNLKKAAAERDVNACNKTVFDLYQLNSDEQATVVRNGGW